MHIIIYLFIFILTFFTYIYIYFIPNDLEKQEGHDFIEGVISHLVLKKQPEWKPRTLSEIDDQQLKKEYFDTPAKHPIQFLNDINYHQHPYQHFSLPSEKEIQQVIQQQPTWTLKQTIEHYQLERKNKFGVQEKVTDVWNRYKKRTLSN